MTDIRIVREYSHPPEKVWKALTEPVLIARWLMRPEGFEAKIGNRFRLTTKPQPGWRGFVECEVIEVIDGCRLAYRWVGNENGKSTIVRYSLETIAGGTRLIFEHTGFSGLGGFILAKMMLGPGWRKMFSKTIPKILDALRANGSLDSAAEILARFGEPIAIYSR